MVFHGRRLSPQIPAVTSREQVLSYRNAGVNIGAGNVVVERIKPLAAKSVRPEVMGGIGGFGALFDLAGKYREPVLVSGTDGVGTKLKLAQQLGRHDTIGIDLVAMCANDVLVQGAEPLFFLDYFATGRLDPDTTVAVVSGIARGCGLAGCALIGGETAEMPGMYPEGEYDLAGFCVGGAEKTALIDGHAVRAGDLVLGIASSGPHSNGYSLIRSIVERAGAPFELEIDGVTLADALMAPTTIYVKPVLDLLQADDPRAPGPESRDLVHGMAHITGGGLTENIIRTVPEGLGVAIDSSAWNPPAIFDWLQREGNLAREEMWRTFNCGIGFTLVVGPGDAASVHDRLAQAGLPNWTIGEIVPADSDKRVDIT